MNNGLLYFGGLLVVVLSALFAVPNFIDWNGYRGVFEEEASKVLGRDVRVGGSVNLKLLPVPYVRFEKVRIANLTGQTGEAFVRAESFTMWLSGPALLRGVLEASEIELNKPILTLAVDAQGGGNWADIELKRGDLPFVPRDVSLRSVKLIDGALSIYNAATERVAFLEGINGELSADGLRGPFRFKGSAAWSGALHDVKFATDVPASDGAFSLKASARAERSPNIYMLDGRVFDLSRKPTFRGSWTGRLAVPGSEAMVPDKKAEQPLLDLTSHVTADALGAKFENIALSLDNAAEPQTITGSATATWSASPRLDLTLISKWLDIDWLAGAGKGGASFSSLKRLAIGLMQSVSGDSTATAKISLEQVKVGGETAGGLIVDADRRGNITHFGTFEASLPGGSQLNLTGDLKADAGKLSFTGSAFIGGTSLARLRTWAEKSGMPLDVTTDGPFSLGGKLDIDETRFVLTDASGDISGHALAGDLTFVHEGRERIDVTLQAADLNSREVFPQVAAALKTEFRKAIGLAPPLDEEHPQATSLGDMRLRVIANRVTDGEETYRDVDVTFEQEGSETRLPAAKLVTESGLSIGLEGRVKAVEGTAKGTLAYDLVAATPNSLQELFRKTGLLGLFGEDRFKGLKEGKIAGLIRLGQRKAGATDIAFDGTLNGLHLSGAAEFDGGLGDWRSQPSRVYAGLDAPSLPSLLATLGPEVYSSVGGSGGTGSARASFVAAGSISSGSEARVDVASQGLTVSVNGRAEWPENANLVFKGIADVKTADYADVLAVAGMALPGGAAGVAAQGRLEIKRSDGVWSVLARDFSLGTSRLAGELKVDNVEGDFRIGGRVSADRVMVAGLLSALVDKPSAPAASAANGAVAALEGPPVWPDGLFNFNAFGRVQADIKVDFRSLEMSGALVTRDGAMKVAFAPGRFSVSDLSASAAGGKLTGSFSLDKAANGVAMSTSMTLDQAKLSSLSPAGKGQATIDLNAEARAQSPAGLIAVMTGSGHVKLAGAEIPGPSGAAASDVIEAVLRGKLQNDPRAISAALVTALNASKLPIGDRQLTMSIADGSAKFDTIVLDSADGRVEATATADLTTLGLNAACQLTSRVKPLPPPPMPLPGWQPLAPKALLPPAIVLYSGPLDNLAAVKANADVVSLQRELVVRQMERNVEELNLSRRVDEERVRLEKERRKTLAADRAAAIAAERAKKEPEQLPPVLPESAGTVGSPEAAAKSDMLVPMVPPGQQGAGGPAAPAVNSDTGTNTVLTPKISIEPIPPPAGEVNQGDAAVTIDPQTGLPIATKPAQGFRPAKSAATRTQPRRTSSDEVKKSLGGFP